MFIKPPKRIIYCYGVYQNLYDEMKPRLDNLLLFNGLPSKEDLKIWSSNGEHSLIVLGDLMTKCSSSQDICDLFTVCSHHMNFTVFFLVQNLFSGGKQFRNISLNAHQFIIFKNQWDELQVKTFARQVFPDNTKFFMSAYKKATDANYGYLFVDLSPHSDSLYRLRTKILPGETTIVYRP